MNCEDDGWLEQGKGGKGPGTMVAKSSKKRPVFHDSHFSGRAMFSLLCGSGGIK